MLCAVDVRVPIGEFSKMTYLSVKALRHYHDVGLLEPSQIDPATGYRFYAPEQLSTAQAIRRFRDLDMPLEQIRAVLDAPDVEARNDAIVAHLQHMQQQLERTQHTVASLQALLANDRPTLAVELRTVEPQPVLAITTTLAFDDAGAWLDGAYVELHDAIGDVGLRIAGADGALYEEDFFQDDVGTLTAFVPVAGTPSIALSGRVFLLDIPGTAVAVMHHEGPYDELDQTYAALGTFVTERGIGVAGPIRESYTADERAEVAWPIQASGAG